MSLKADFEVPEDNDNVLFISMATFSRWRPDTEQGLGVEVSIAPDSP